MENQVISSKNSNIFRKTFRNWLLSNPSLWVNPLSVQSVGRALTGSMRVLPDFLIIGGQKCGTTSLYNYLLNHPDIYSSLWKEVNFFDKNFHRGITWYRANFPTLFQKFCTVKILKKKFRCGDATPYYLFHPHSAKRIHETLPKVKLIVLLRNPVDRAYSHYNMEKRLGYEKLSFEEAIESEEKRLENEKEKMIYDSDYQSFNFQVYSYLSRGKYIEQFNEWFKYFKKDDLLILETEEFKRNKQKILSQTFDFLSIDDVKFTNLQNENVGKYPSLDENTRIKLIEYFKPYNKKLFELLGKTFDWDV
mgnify:FL=1